MYHVTYIIEDLEACIPQASLEQAEALVQYLFREHQIRAVITPSNSTPTESLPNTSTQM